METIKYSKAEKSAFTAFASALVIVWVWMAVFVLRLSYGLVKSIINMWKKS